METITTSFYPGEVGGASGEEEEEEELFLPGPCAVRFCPVGMRIRGGIPVRPLAPSKEAVSQEIVEEKNEEKKAPKRKLAAVEADEDVELDFELDEKVGSTSGQFATSLPKRKAGGVLTEVKKGKIHEQGETSTESELTADELEPGAAPRVAEV